jgi:CheY-like chemotaxis protein
MDRVKGSILFVYPRFGLALYAIAVWLVIAIWLTYFLSQSQLRIQNNIEVDFKNQQALFLASLMKKIKHDIRSPLSVLEALIEDKPKDEKWFQEQCLLALKRINEIISESDQHKSGIYLTEQKRQSLFEIKSLAQQIITEKHLLIDNVIECEFDLTPCFTKIDAGKLKATLSNILDNAIQASEEKSKIKLKIETDETLTIIQVIDSGKGIPSHILPKLCSEGFTHGKSNGSGLGLYYAKKLVEGIGGNIQIESTEGFGTTVTLLIPKIETPSWSFEKIDIHQYKSVIICDDQDYIRDLWKMRLKDLGFNGEISFFKNGEELLAENATFGSPLYLIDYDMGKENIRGIELIKRLNHPLNSILVTGHYDDSKIQNLCSEVGCKLLAKDQIARFANPL